MLLGSDSQRLHEELIFAGGYLREGRFSRMNQTDAQRLLQAAQPRLVPPKPNNCCVHSGLTPRCPAPIARSSYERSLGRPAKKAEESKQKEIHDITLF